MFRLIIEKIFYNPYKVVRKNKNLIVDASSVLLNTMRFRLHSLLNIVEIGNDSTLGCEIVFESEAGKVSIGNHTFINGDTRLISRSSITIGNYVTISWGCTIYDHNSHSLDYIERQKDIDRQLTDHRNGKNFIHSKDWSVVKSRPIIIKDNAWIGFNCIILGGVTIGEGAIVGAGSVVREDVEPWTVVAGNPVVLVKRLR